MTDPAVAPLWICQEQDGTKELCDLTGSVVDLTAAEAACEKRELSIALNRPSAKRRVENRRREEAAFSIYERYGIRSNDPSEPIDLILHQGGFELSRVEPPIGEAAKALHEMLTEHNLVAPPA